MLAAALLHDIGHGPFSHVFENVTSTIQTGVTVRHESWSRLIIQEDTDVQEILRPVSADLPENIDQIIAGTFAPHYVTAVVNSQLDIDRFDYLLRDSLMTGCRYGSFDLEWMLRTLAIQDVIPGPNRPPLKTVVVDGRRGISGLEQYVLGRHYMYQHVYFHKTIRSAEMMLGAILRRAAESIRYGDTALGNGTLRRLARGEPVNVPAYMELNDFLILAWIEDWSGTHSDPVLKELSGRLIHRHLFKAILAPRQGRAYADAEREIWDILDRQGYTRAYYFLADDGAKDVAYKGVLYNLAQGKDADEAEIWCANGMEAPQRLSIKSQLLSQTSRALSFDEERWFVPAEIHGEVRGVVDRISGRV